MYTFLHTWAQEWVPFFAWFFALSTYFRLEQIVYKSLILQMLLCILWQWKMPAQQQQWHTSAMRLLTRVLQWQRHQQQMHHDNQRCRRNNSNGANAMRALVWAQWWQRCQQQRQHNRQQQAGTTKGQEGGQEEWGGGQDVWWSIGGWHNERGGGWQCNARTLWCPPPL